MRVEGFILHLARAEQRRAQVDLLRERLPMPVDVVDAVDGREMTAHEIAAVYRPRLYRPHYPFRLTPGEIGCFLSHRRAWTAIVEKGIDAGFIIEDDVDIDPSSFRPLLDFVLDRFDPGSYVRFPWRDRSDAGPVRARQGGLSLVELRHTGLGTLGQLVGREAAALLLEKTQAFDRPVDAFMQMRWHHGVRMLAAKPVCLANLDAALGGTTLTVRSRRRTAQAIGRELRRFRYRLSVRLRERLG